MPEHIQRRLSFLKELLGPLEFRLPTPQWEAIAAEMDALERDSAELVDRLNDWQSLYSTLRDWVESGDPPTGPHPRRVDDERREAG